MALAALFLDLIQILSNVWIRNEGAAQRIAGCIEGLSHLKKGAKSVAFMSNEPSVNSGEFPELDGVP